MSHLPLFGFACLVFLGISTTLAVAAFLVFKSGEKGSTKLGGCAGAAIGCALVFIACLAAFGVALVAAATAKSELVKHGPVQSFEFELQPDSGPPPPMPGSGQSNLAPPAQNWSATLRVELRGSADVSDITSRISDWLRDNTDGQISVHTRKLEKGGGTMLEFGLDVDRAQLDDLRRGLRQAVPDWRLPKRVKVEIKNE